MVIAKEIELKHSDDEILAAVDEYMSGSNRPDFVSYRKQTLARDYAHKHVFMWCMRHLCQLGNMKNARILDVGCGCGWQALAVSMVGHNSVVGNDILPSMIDGAKEAIESLRLKNTYEFDVKALLGDICDLDLPDESFDAIYSMESIEHVHDIDRMFDNCVRLLAPNGTIILWNDCNLFNRKIKNGLEKTFNKREDSWEYCEYLRSIRPIEHGDARPFAVMRREIIEAANPSLDRQEIELLAWCTAGMLKPRIEQLAKTYTNGVELPDRSKIDWCRNPLTGEYAERLFDPYELAEKLKRRGLVTKVHHAFRRWPLRLLNSIQFRLLNNLLFDVKSVFIVLARKVGKNSI